MEFIADERTSSNATRQNPIASCVSLVVSNAVGTTVASSGLPNMRSTPSWWTSTSSCRQSHRFVLLLPRDVVAARDGSHCLERRHLWHQVPLSRQIPVTRTGDCFPSLLLRRRTRLSRRPSVPNRLNYQQTPSATTTPPHLTLTSLSALSITFNGLRTPWT